MAAGPAGAAGFFDAAALVGFLAVFLYRRFAIYRVFPIKGYTRTAFAPFNVHGFTPYRHHRSLSPADSL